MHNLILGSVVVGALLLFAGRARATGIGGLVTQQTSEPIGPVTVRIAEGRSVTLGASEIAAAWARLRPGIPLGRAIQLVNAAWACNDTRGLEFVWGNGPWDPNKPAAEIFLHQAIGAASGTCRDRVYKGGVLRRLPGVGEALRSIQQLLRMGGDVGRASHRCAACSRRGADS